MHEGESETFCSSSYPNSVAGGHWYSTIVSYAPYWEFLEQSQLSFRRTRHFSTRNPQCNNVKDVHNKIQLFPLPLSSFCYIRIRCVFPITAKVYCYTFRLIHLSSFEDFVLVKRWYLFVWLKSLFGWDVAEDEDIIAAFSFRHYISWLSFLSIHPQSFNIMISLWEAPYYLSGFQLYLVWLRQKMGLDARPMQLTQFVEFW